MSSVPDMVVITLSAVVLALSLLALSCCLTYIVRYVSICWHSLNRDQLEDINYDNEVNGNISNHEFPPPYSVEDPNRSTASHPTSDDPSVAQTGDINASFNGVQPSPNPNSDSALGTSSTQAYGSSSILLHTDAEESRGTAARPSPYLPSYEEACDIYSDNPPSYSVEDPYDSLDPDTSQTPGTLQGNSQARGNPQEQLEDLGGDSQRCSDVLPLYIELFPHDPPVSALHSNVPPVVPTGHANVSVQEEEAMPSPSGPSEAALAIGDLSPSQAGALSLVASPSDTEGSPGTRPLASASSRCGGSSSGGARLPTSASPGCGRPKYDYYEFLGVRPRTSASAGCQPPLSSAEASCGARSRTSPSVGHGLPRYEDVCAFDCDDPVPYRAPNVYEAGDAAPTPATLQDSSGSGEGGKTGFQLLDPNDAPPRGSATASPSFAPEDLQSSISFDLQCLPHALDGPPGEQIQPAIPRAVEVEVTTTVSPPNALDVGLGGSILEPVPRVDEMDLPQTTRL